MEYFRVEKNNFAVCWNCGTRCGYQLATCPYPRQSRGSGGCFSCSGYGHMAKDCPTPFYQSIPPRSCPECGYWHWLNRDCPSQAEWSPTDDEDDDDEYVW
jgi:hypothetical protein